MGHLPGWEYDKHVESAMRRGISRKQFIEEENFLFIYRPEFPMTNWSHKYEGPSSLDYWKMLFG